MKKVLIIEDDFYNAYRLKNLIREVDDTLEVHGPLKSVEEVVRELSENNDYDLIFSDIRLIDEMFSRLSGKSSHAPLLFSSQPMKNTR